LSKAHHHAHPGAKIYEFEVIDPLIISAASHGGGVPEIAHMAWFSSGERWEDVRGSTLDIMGALSADKDGKIPLDISKMKFGKTDPWTDASRDLTYGKRYREKLEVTEKDITDAAVYCSDFTLELARKKTPAMKERTTTVYHITPDYQGFLDSIVDGKFTTNPAETGKRFSFFTSQSAAYQFLEGSSMGTMVAGHRPAVVAITILTTDLARIEHEMVKTEATRLGVDFQTVWKDWKRSIEDEMTAPAGTIFYAEAPNFASKTIEGGKFKNIAVLMTTNPMSGIRKVFTMPTKKGQGEIMVTPAMGKYVEVLNNAKEAISVGKNTNVTLGEIKTALDGGFTTLYEKIGVEATSAKVMEGVKALEDWLDDNLSGEPVTRDFALKLLGDVQQWHSARYEYSLRRIHTLAFDMDGTLIAPKNPNLKFDVHGNLLPPEFDKSGKQISGYDPKLAGYVVRPHALELLQELQANGKEVVIWSHCSKARLEEVFASVPELEAFFPKDASWKGIDGKPSVSGRRNIVIREDYAMIPGKLNAKGEPAYTGTETFKDIKKVGADILIDDLPAQKIEQVNHGNRAIGISQYMGGKSFAMKDLETVMFPETRLSRLGKSLQGVFEDVFEADLGLSGKLREARIQAREVQLQLLPLGAEKTIKEAELAQLKKGGEIVEFPWGKKIPIMYLMTEGVKLLKDLQKDGELVVTAINEAKSRLDTELGAGKSDTKGITQGIQKQAILTAIEGIRKDLQDKYTPRIEALEKARLDDVKAKKLRPNELEAISTELTELRRLDSVTPKTLDILDAYKDWVDTNLSGLTERDEVLGGLEMVKQEHMLDFLSPGGIPNLGAPDVRGAIALKRRVIERKVEDLVHFRIRPRSVEYGFRGLLNYETGPFTTTKRRDWTAQVFREDGGSLPGEIVKVGKTGEGAVVMTPLMARYIDTLRAIFIPKIEQFKAHTVILDLDGTIIAEGKGKGGKPDELRPGAVDLLVALKLAGKEVIIWTHSNKERTQRIINLHPDLQALFNDSKTGKLDPMKVKTREDYAIGKDGKVLPEDTFKNISIFGKDSILIDNNKSQIEQQANKGNMAVDISTYYGGKSSGLKDMFRKEMAGRGQFVTPAEAKILQDLYKERENALTVAKEVADSASALNLVRELQAKVEERMKEAAGTIFTTAEAKQLLELYKKRDEALASEAGIRGLEKTQVRIAELELKANANKFAYGTYVFDFDGCVIAQPRGKGKYKASKHEALHLVEAIREYGEKGQVKVKKVKDEALVRELRPGVIELMQAMQRDGKKVVIWTHSTEKRMQGIVNGHPELQALFNDPKTGKLDPQKVTTFKDYAGGRKNAGNRSTFKPVAQKYGIDSILIDNSATQVKAQHDNGNHAVKITTYRGGESSGMSSLFVPQAKARNFTSQTYIFNLVGTLVSRSKNRYGKYELRPGAVELLRELENNGKQVVLWTDLPRKELKRVLSEYPDTLQKIFPEVWNDKNYNDKKVRCKEDYIKRGDPFSTNKLKDIRKEFGENSILVDNNKMQIDLQKNAGNKYAEVTTYNGGKSSGLADLFMEDVKGKNPLISVAEAKELQGLQMERARALEATGKDSRLTDIQARIAELESKKNANTFTYDAYVFSMEGTISAEGKGKNGKVDELRPGAVDLLVALSATGKKVAIWTYLDKERVQRIIDTNAELQALFNDPKTGKLDPTKVKAFEDYGLGSKGEKLPSDTFKDIRKEFGENSVLIDNNKVQIQLQKDNNNKAVSVTTYHGGKSSGLKDMLDIELVGMGQLIAPAVAEALLVSYKARENALIAAKEATRIAGALDLAQGIQSKIARLEAERMEELGGLEGTGKLLTPKEATRLMGLYKKRAEALLVEARVSALPQMESRIKELEEKQKARKYSYGTYVFDFGTIVSQGEGKAKGRHALRPGVIELMQSIQRDGKKVAIWTHSDRKLTQEIVNMHPDLANIFNDSKTGKLDPTKVKTRENYARFKDENTFKDMRKEFGTDSVLIDSNVSQIKQQHDAKNNAVLAASLESTGKMSTLLTGNEKVRNLTSQTYIFNLVGTLVFKGKEGKYELRPGAMELLQELKNEGKNTVLWTDLSRREVGIILGQHHVTLGKIFPSIWDYNRVRTKEHYGGERVTPNTFKDIRKEFGENSILVDNNKVQIDLQKNAGNKYAEVASYSGGKSSGLVDLFMEDAMGKSAVITALEAKELQVLQGEHAKALESKGKGSGLADIQARIAELEAKARFAYDTYVLDLDGTIVAEGKGKAGKKEELRPGTVELLNALVLANRKIVIWTHSTEKRTQRIINKNPLLANIFNDPKTGKLDPTKVKTREDYAIGKDGKPLPKDTFKDIRKEFGENSILIDNSASQIKKQHNAGNNAADISTYYGGKSGGLKELGAQLLAEVDQIERNADAIGTMKKWAELNLPEKPTQADITQGIELTKKYIKQNYGREETYAQLLKGMDALNELLMDDVRNGASKGDIINRLGTVEQWFVGERKGTASPQPAGEPSAPSIIETNIAKVEAEIKILENKAQSGAKLTVEEALSLPNKYAERDALFKARKETRENKTTSGKEKGAETELLAEKRRLDEERRGEGSEARPRGITEFAFGREERRGGEEQKGAGEYPHGEYPHGEYPAGEYPHGEYPHGEYPHGEYPHGEYPHGEYPRGEYPEGEYPHGEYPHGEYPHGEYPHGEYPHKEYHYKEKTPPIIKKKRGKVLTKAELEASIAWKQGVMYKLIYPPYGQNDIINSRVPFPGMRIHTGARSAFATLIRTQKGRLPSTIVRDMGMMHIRIEGGSRSTTSKPKMRFHEREERRGKGAVKTKESSGQTMTKLNGGAHG
jgi:beta-phosphoglucomutase-like phosphatase (HAD superfamily)